MVPYNSNLPAYDQNLQVVIVRQTITNAQGTYAITKSLLQGDSLTAFEIVEGNIGPQTESNYEQTTKDMHLYMFSINKRLAQFPPRDNRTFQEKLADNKLMDILENAMPKSWQEEMQRQCFDCVADRQSKSISFCKNPELLDPPKNQA
eukprot:1706627-Ditylum_brightwellii.AAC.2